MKIILFGFMLIGLIGSVSYERTEDKVVNTCSAAESDYIVVQEQFPNHISPHSTLSNTQITSAQAVLENDIKTN